MEDSIFSEYKKRKALWEEMKEKFPNGEVPVDFVKRNYIYRGRAGTYVDKERTSQLTKHTSLPEEDKKAGITVSIRLVGDSYPNDISEDGSKFRYPNVDRRGRQAKYKVQASKNALKLDLPIFIVIGKTMRKNGESVYERVELAKVAKYDDEDKSFEVKFIKEALTPLPTEGVDSFELDGSGETKIVSTKARLGQAEFRSSVMENYGEKCAVCNVRHPDLLDAAHIVAKAERGTDDLRNGIVLCKNHHAAFDNNLFGINPESKKLVFLSKEIKQELNFPQRKLKTATGVLPNIKALRWKWKRFQKVLKEANQ